MPNNESTSLSTLYEVADALDDLSQRVFWAVGKLKGTIKAARDQKSVELDEVDMNEGVEYISERISEMTKYLEVIGEDGQTK